MCSRGEADAATNGAAIAGGEDGDGDGEVGEVGGSSMGPLAGCIGPLKTRFGDDCKRGVDNDDDIHDFA